MTGLPHGTPACLQRPPFPLHPPEEVGRPPPRPWSPPPAPAPEPPPAWAAAPLQYGSRPAAEPPAPPPQRYHHYGAAVCRPCQPQRPRGRSKEWRGGSLKRRHTANGCLPPPFRFGRLPRFGPPTDSHPKPPIDSSSRGPQQPALIERSPPLSGPRQCPAVAAAAAAATAARSPRTAARRGGGVGVRPTAGPGGPWGGPAPGGGSPRPGPCCMARSFAPFGSGHPLVPPKVSLDEFICLLTWTEHASAVIF